MFCQPDRSSDLLLVRRRWKISRRRHVEALLSSRIDRSIMVDAERQFARRRLLRTTVNTRAPVWPGENVGRDRGHIEFERVVILESDALCDPDVLADWHGARAWSGVLALRIDTRRLYYEGAAFPVPNRGPAVGVLHILR